MSGKQDVKFVPIDENNACFRVAIDVDEYQLDLKGLAKKLVKHKLPLDALRRSKGDWAHICLFIDERVSASLLQRNYVNCLASVGFGQAEIFS